MPAQSNGDSADGPQSLGGMRGMGPEERVVSMAGLVSSLTG